MRVQEAHATQVCGLGPTKSRNKETRNGEREIGNKKWETSLTELLWTNEKGSAIDGEKLGTAWNGIH